MAESTKRKSVPHTQVPNLLEDFVLPLLKPAEASCLRYIVRRTIGFGKEIDRISLSQFQHGITTGPYVLDLGTGIKSKTSIIAALRGLHEKLLVEVWHSCSRCLWEQGTPSAEDTAEAKCPRCGRTADRSWQLAPLTANRLIAFLSEHDPERRHWTFDRETLRFMVVGEQVAQHSEETGIESYRPLVWFPDLVDQVIEQLVGDQDDAYERQLVLHVYRPVLELQEMVGPHQQIIQHALSETIRRGIPKQPREVRKKDGTVARNKNWGWARYTRAIVQNTLAQGGTTRHKSDGKGAARQLEASIQEMLGRARDLNRDGELDAARALLSALLANTKAVAEAHFSGDEERADRALRLAFKLGVDDFRAAEQGLVSSPHDFYPEWS